MLALLLFLGLVLITVVLGFLAAVQGGMHGVSAKNAPRRIVELSRRAAEQAPSDALSSTSLMTAWPPAIKGPGGRPGPPESHLGVESAQAIVAGLPFA